MQTIGEEAVRTGQVEAEYASGVLTLSVSGDIDHHGAADLRKSVEREIYYYRPKLVLMKLGGVYARVANMQGAQALEEAQEVIGRE